MSSSNDNQSNTNSYSIDGLAALQNYLADFSKELDDEPPSSTTASAVGASSLTYGGDDDIIPATSSYQSTTTIEQNYPNLVPTSECHLVDLNETHQDTQTNEFGHFLPSASVKSSENSSRNSEANNLIVLNQNDNLSESVGVGEVATSSYVNREIVATSSVDETKNKNNFPINQPIILTMGGGGNVLQNNQQQSIIIPLMPNSNVVGSGGNTILLPLNSLISSSDGGVIELRLATSSMPVLQQTGQNSQQQPLIFLLNNSSNGGGMSFVTMDNNSLIIPSTSSQNAVIDIPPASERMATFLVPMPKTPPQPTATATPRSKSNKTPKNNNTNSNIVLLQETPNVAVADQQNTQNIFITVSAADSEENKFTDEQSSADVVRVTVVPPTPSSTDAVTTLQTKLPKGESFHCQFCDYTNAKRYLMLRHMKSHSEDRPHKCPVCERRFKTPNSLQNHINTHTGVRPHQCKMCEATFTTSGEMIRHVRYKHTLEKPHKCPHCDYASVELSKLKRHMRSHSGERPYQCPNCVYASPDTYKLKRHMRVHTGEKPYECDVCLQRFTQSNSLKAHKLIHAGTKPVFQCEFCPSSCGRKTDLKIHMQKLHGPVEITCKKCGLTFTDRYTFKIHMKSHDGERFRCDICDYETSLPRHLDAHLSLHGDDKSGVPCKECNLTFVNSHCLTRHWNTTHNPNYVAPEPKEKLYFCHQCPKSFYIGASLSKHVARKHGEQLDLENVSSHQTEQSSSFGRHQNMFDMEADTDDDDDDDDEECAEDESLWMSMNDDGRRIGGDGGAREIIISVDDDSVRSRKSTVSHPTKRRRTNVDATSTTNENKKKRKKRTKSTNVRRPGRPKKQPGEKNLQHGDDEPPLNDDYIAENYQTTSTTTVRSDAKDVKNLYSFASMSTSNVHSREIESTYVDVNEDSTETTLAVEGADLATDASLEPLVINDGNGGVAASSMNVGENIEINDNNDNVEGTTASMEGDSSSTIIFDLTAEERSEICRLVYENGKKPKS